MSKDREPYLKFKPMADDLRRAESWCESDGVLNRNKTMQNLYKMGYRKQSEWISVDERLPEEEVPVIVYKRNNDIFGNMESAYLYKGKWVGTIGEYVTHWMPLPEAPKMKGGK